MGLFDRFKKKKEEASKENLHSLPSENSSEGENMEELPPLPEIKVEPDSADLIEGSEDPVEISSSEDSLGELPDLPDISISSNTGDNGVSNLDNSLDSNDFVDEQDDDSDEFELPKLDELSDEKSNSAAKHLEIEPEPLNRTPIVKELATIKAKPVGSMANTSDVPAHIFVSSNDYRKILDGVDFLKGKLDGAQDFVSSLNTIKKEEAKQIESMRNLLEDIQRKITYVDEVIFQAE